ncbi:MAG: aminotransferase class V-fold PLP-dependent enzyme [Clostridia bacterium]|nr:aminotransferase class V-fold PLP-dependent enzyme [Clostridia bacterium]
MNRVYNFSAGPSMLPMPVLQKAADELLCYGESGMSVMEMSHRSADYEPIIADAEAMLRKLMNIPDNYKVLFLQGGASTQFAAVPLNLIGRTGKADYAVSGQFSGKAFKEAQKMGYDVKCIATTKDDNFDHVPVITKDMIRPDAAYLHICFNNTIYGTKYPYIPDTGDVPLVADLSSCIISEPVNPKKPNEIGRTGKKLLKRAIGQSRERELALPVPQIENAAGTLIPLEENESAYQYRRNFCHTMLNILGFSLQSVQGMMGHDIPSLRSKRWMLYHEAKLIEQMNRMDQLILFPIASEEARTNEWEQTDPRKDIHVIDECGEFLDECALTLSAQPYSPTDVITLHLFVKCNEPTDALTITALTDGTEITAYPYSFTQEPNTTINIRNHYLDMVFAMCKKNIGKLDVEEDETLDDEMDITADETELEKYEAIPSEFDDDNADFLFEDDDVDMDYDIETENG